MILIVDPDPRSFKKRGKDHDHSDRGSNDLSLLLVHDLFNVFNLYIFLSKDRNGFCLFLLFLNPFILLDLWLTDLSVTFLMSPVATFILRF